MRERVLGVAVAVAVSVDGVGDVRGAEVLAYKAGEDRRDYGRDIGV